VSSWGGCPIDSLPTIYADVRALSEFIEEFVPPYLHDDCYDVEIAENTTWTADDIPSSRLGEVRVLGGATFEISQDAVLEFCEDGVLIVEPNAHLKLNGTLTTACGEDYWQGIKVYGDSTENQFFDFGAGVYHQGLFNAYPGSVVENAITAVELWGPTSADSGGKIYCDSATFRNNRIGVFFMPYQNIYGGQPRPYRAGFTNCIFTIDDHFPHAQFFQHAAFV
jgi:hypothetical protein